MFAALLPSCPLLSPPIGAGPLSPTLSPTGERGRSFAGPSPYLLPSRLREGPGRAEAMGLKMPWPVRRFAANRIVWARPGRWRPRVPHIDLSDVVIILAASVAALFVLRRVNLSPVLGYLAAGMLIGPFGIGLVTDVDSIHIFAEFGVVFLLFTIGLELPWERIKVLPPALFALGLTQILVTGAAISGIALALGVALDAAIVIGAALSLSSTVFVIQILVDRRQLPTRFGRASFTVLMMQDLAVAPHPRADGCADEPRRRARRVPRHRGAAGGRRSGRHRGAGPLRAAAPLRGRGPPNGTTRSSPPPPCWW